jgi:peroxiredoxin
MARSDNIYQLPADLPIPTDDGASNHLLGVRIPSAPLRSTDGDMVDLATLSGTTVVYAYPRTGEPDRDVPAGWNDIPGARGCTPQSCGFRDHHTELQALGARVFGLSTQDTAYQREVVERLHLPFPILSDQQLTFTRALRLPTFNFEGTNLLKRIALVVVDGTIVKVFYPVFPPDKNSEEVIAWLTVESIVPVIR